MRTADTLATADTARINVEGGTAVEPSGVAPLPVPALMPFLVAATASATPLALTTAAALAMSANDKQAVLQLNATGTFDDNQWR